ncbi:hypothetical protein VNO80_24793 [Phaseolus coccineus]|uniref:Exoribonuclease phosphorolytic domain-containing protein n=1 Tax=Phaseolus coccineus TaxID=3886 RepID=A0AAN9QSP8_PHACN
MIFPQCSSFHETVIYSSLILSNNISEHVAGDLPVVISCASLALADAGIMMYELVASVSVSSFSKNLVIDPILEEEKCQDGSLMITCMPSRYEITQLTVTGEWSSPKINEGMQLCLDACAKLAKIMRSCFEKSCFGFQGVEWKFYINTNHNMCF